MPWEPEALPSLALRLRAATRAAHRALDHHPLLAPLVRPDLTMAHYGRALAALYAPQAALEERLASFARALGFPPRAPALAADLRMLGVAPFALMATLPCVEDTAGMIGMMYVCEGANLGGQVIARALAAHLPTAPRRFFASAEGEARWARFWRFAPIHCPLEQASRAEQAACATFAFYQAHLDACLGARPSGRGVRKSTVPSTAQRS